MADMLEKIAQWLVGIGALVWLPIGIADWNFIDAIFGAGSGFARLIYVLVGISGAYLFYKMFK
ncbi:MAG: protein of unknown function DUF378 [Siphoviridae sp. ctjeG17]|nr:MAG: protein of unknown function DUF378 [Siphoviridae sp. ctjeG17]